MCRRFIRQFKPLGNSIWRSEERISKAIDRIEELKVKSRELAADAYAIGGYALVENREGQKGKSPVIMLHYYRTTPDGIESRTCFWMGYRIVKGHPMCILPPGMKLPVDFALGLALHNVEEYSNLAPFLPKIYEEYGHQPF